MKKAFGLSCCILLVVLLAGCSSFGKKPEKTAPELAEQGQQYFAKENYSKAIEVYKRLKDWYPYSKHAKEAELRIADSHFKLKEYDEALFAYEQFEELHPGDPDIPYVIFQIGRSHYNQMKGVDRTQVPAQKALDAFKRLQQHFPRSDYAEKAEPLMDEVHLNLAGHEFYVAKYYYKSGYYKAAIRRFEKVINEHPDVGNYHEEAREYIADAKSHIQAVERGEEDPPEPPADSGVPAIEDDGPDPVL